MKRLLNFWASMVAILGIAFLVMQCGKEEGTKYSKLTGTVSLADESVADGAIVSLSTTQNGANVVSRTVADENGVYTFLGVEHGTYYVNAKYEPSNNNNALKSAGAVILTGIEQEVTVDGDKTANLEMAGAISDGTASFNSTEWIWDNTHSTIKFEFPYDAVNAVFAGHFATAGIDELIFDEQNPTATSIKAWVDITSVETGAASPPGAHGRDGITGCIVTTFKVEILPTQLMFMIPMDH